MTRFEVPTDAFPERRSHRWWVTIVIGISLVVGCDGSTTWEDLPEIVITGRDYSFEAAQSAEGGLVRVTLENRGRESHQVELVRIVDGSGSADILEAISQGDIAALNAMISYHGGPNEVAPGERRTVVTELESGTYALLCFISSSGGNLHVLQGMIGTIEITEPVDQTAWTPPQPDATVSLNDYRFDLSGEFGGGRQIVLVRNEGTEPHEFRLREGGVNAAGGTSTISPGGETWVEIDLDTGRHAVICFVPSEKAGNRQHIDLGMRASIDVP